MKQLILTFLLLFSMNVYAETYYCTQKTNSSIYFAKEKTIGSDNKTTDDILKIEIDLENKILKSTILDNSGRKPFYFPYFIIEHSDDEDTFVVIATSSTTSKHQQQLSSFIFTHFKKNNEVKLLQNVLRENYGSNTFRYKCSKG